MQWRKWWWGFAAWSLVGCGAQTETAVSPPAWESEEAAVRACFPAEANQVATLWPPDRRWQSPLSREPRPESLTEAQGTLYFKLEENNGDATLWKSDGSAAGTIALARIPYKSPSAPDVRMTDFTAVGTKLFLRVFQEETGWELWASNGTPHGTGLLGDLAPGGDSSNLSGFGALNGDLSFVRVPPTGTGFELWRSNGTASGTHRVMDFAAASALAPGPTLPPSGPAALETRMLFVQEAPENRLRLWRTDGTERGTRPVQSFAAGARLLQAQEQDGAVLLFVQEPTEGRLRLWRSDGTLMGTTPLRELGGGAASVAHTLRLEADLVFAIHAPAQNRLRLWRTNGTAHGTHELMHLNVSDGGHVTGHDVLASTAILRVVRPGSGTELWRTDGTAAGTQRAGLIEGHHTLLGVTETHAVWVQPRPDERRLQIWRMPLATGHREHVADISNPHEDQQSAAPTVQRHAAAGGKFYVTQQVGASHGPATLDMRLWVTDGTEAGTRELTTNLLMSDEYHSDLFDLGNGQLMFDSGSGVAITDGTVEGTLIPVASSSPHPPGRARPLLRVDDTLYFSALAGNPGFTLWSYPLKNTCGPAAP